MDEVYFESNSLNKVSSNLSNKLGKEDELRFERRKMEKTLIKVIIRI